MLRILTAGESHGPLLTAIIEGLPAVPLDGELWIERKKFQRTVSIVRRQDKSDLWNEVRFLVFDAPELPRTSTFKHPWRPWRLGG